MKTAFTWGVVVSALILASTPRLQAAEWCARYDAYSRNCGFHTFQQCLDTVRGAGGICEQNPRAWFRGDRGGRGRY
jgi:hypothetical protein